MRDTKIKIPMVINIIEGMEKRKAAARRTELNALIDALHKAIVQDGDLAAAKPLIERVVAIRAEEEKAKNVLHSPFWYSAKNQRRINQ